MEINMETKIEKDIENDVEKDNVIKLKSNKDHELSTEDHPFSLSLRISNFENEKEERKFIKNCERGIRNSYEYKLWRQYLIDILQLTKCAITFEDMLDVSIEIHHHVPSLYLIVKAIARKYIEDEIKFCTFDVMRDTIELHFSNYLGYVALIKSMHEKFHNGALQIPIEFVCGDYQYFLDNYLQYLDDEDEEKIMDRVNYCNDDYKYIWKADQYPSMMEN
jgi:hypothetical protein